MSQINQYFDGFSQGRNGWIYGNSNGPQQMGLGIWNLMTNGRRSNQLQVNSFPPNQYTYGIASMRTPNIARHTLVPNGVRNLGVYTANSRESITNQVLPQNGMLYPPTYPIGQNFIGLNSHLPGGQLLGPSWNTGIAAWYGNSYGQISPRMNPPNPLMGHTTQTLPPGQPLPDQRTGVKPNNRQPGPCTVLNQPGIYYITILSVKLFVYQYAYFFNWVVVHLDVCEVGREYRRTHPCKPCTHYITCYEGNVFEQVCPLSTVFDSGRGECNWPKNVPECDTEKSF